MAAVAKTLKQNLLWITLGLVASGAVVVWLLLNSPGENMGASLKNQTAPVVREDITVTITATGVMKPLTPVNISPKQSGRLVALLVEQGDRVKKGQILARMDSSNFQGQRLQAQGSLEAAEANLRKLEKGNRLQEIQSAEANLFDAQAQLTNARATHQRNQALLNDGAISKTAFDLSLAQYQSAEARVRSAQAQKDLMRAGFRREDIDTARAQVLQARGALLNMQTQIDDTAIRAPFDGVITQKFTNVGAFVTPTTSASATSSATSSSILSLAGPLEAVTNVAEADIRNIYPGQKVNLLVDAYPDQVFQGQVRLVAPEAVVTQNVSSFEVRVQVVDKNRDQLRSGMNLKGEFLVGTVKDALLIPTTSIVSEGNKTGVFVPRRGEKERPPKFLQIKVGPTVGSQTQVLSGLEEGDPVFITLPARRKPNDKAPNQNSPFGSPQPGNRPPR